MHRTNDKRSRKSDASSTGTAPKRPKIAAPSLSGVLCETSDSTLNKRVNGMNTNSGPSKSVIRLPQSAFRASNNNDGTLQATFRVKRSLHVSLCPYLPSQTCDFEISKRGFHGVPNTVRLE